METITGLTPEEIQHLIETLPKGSLNMNDAIWRKAFTIRNTDVAKKAFVLNTGCYRQDIIVTMNMRGKEIEKLFKKWEVKPLSEEFKEAIDNKDQGTGLYFYHSKSQHRLITLFPTDYANAITVFDHEKTHCVADVLRYVGIELSEETEEAYAYLSEWLMLQFLKKA